MIKENSRRKLVKILDATASAEQFKDYEASDDLDASGDDIFEMSNLATHDTGLGWVVWVSTDINKRHSRPRLKVTGSDQQRYPVSIDDPIEYLATPAPGVSAKDFQNLASFIQLNRDLLLRYWRAEIGTKEMVNGIVSI